jgi:pyruvate dehydrogenase complex dehydrogenase (E1) component
MADDLDPMETREWLDSLDSVGDADPFRSQAAELASVLRRHGLRLTTLFWNGTGDYLNQEYQFDFDLPQARTAFERTLAFHATTTRS